ncbi:MAG: ADP-ribosylglycohydrolase family protein [Verrucomicrobiota bacterium]
MNKDRTSAVVNSALWAAYGDALGFITELTDAAGVKRRVKTDFVEHTVPWRRMVGGQFGGQVTLPAGCYSDDTQLRLATSRAIRPDGSFDVDAFAKVELPVFDAYALGAGNSTKSAAHALASHSVAWFSNFYRQGKSNYVEAGGNGGVMRIQPHVWCEMRPGLSPQCVREIIRNVFCSHGHPRALAGALFHAAQLALAIRERTLVEPMEWRDALRAMNTVPDLLRRDEQLSLIWIPTWEQATHRSWDEAWRETLHELDGFVRMAVECAREDGPVEERYRKLVTRLEATSEKVRGEAMRTAVLAQFLAWACRNDSPRRTVLLAANVLNTDTDTIASVAGALHGAITDEPPDDEILDRDYIISEAVRLDRVARGQKVEYFRYPNVLTWQPPRSQLDVVCVNGGKLYVAGLGVAKEEGKPLPGRKRDEAWQILLLDFGQTVVIKRRARPLPCAKSETAMIEPNVDRKPLGIEKTTAPTTGQLSLGETVDDVVPKTTSPQTESMDELTNRLIAQGFPPSAIGETLLRLAQNDDGLEKAIAFSAIIVKAKRARLRKEKGDARVSE